MSTTSPPRPRSWPHAVTVGLACILGLLVLDLAVMIQVQQNIGLARWDLPLHHAAVAARTPGLTAFLAGFTALGSTWPVAVLGLIATSVLFATTGQRSVWVLAVATPMFSVSVSEGLKVLFARARPPAAEAVPPLETSFSFPSGHSLNSAAISGVLAYLAVWAARRTWTRIAAVIAAASWSLLMGFSRIYLGHHWPSDVIGGWLLGLTCVAILATAHQGWHRHRERSTAGAQTTQSDT